jgi:hypothetical protein
MPDFEIRRAEAGNRREGRRSLSAYGSHARSARSLAGSSLAVGRAQTRGQGRTATARHNAGGSSAGIALALVYPLMARACGARKRHAATVVAPQSGGAEGTGFMKRKPSIKSLETVSVEEAAAYVEDAGGDELTAACALAWDRNRLDGSHAAPDDAEVHHALFLLCRARGQHPPSFDGMRVELRRRVAA